MSMPTTFNKLNSSPIKITWRKLYKDIYCKFNTTESQLIEVDFLKAVFPSDLLKTMFIRNDTFQEKYASMVCRAADQVAPNRFFEARDFLLSLTTPSRESYRYNTCPIILEFQANWESLIPISKPKENINQNSDILTPSDDKCNLQKAIEDLIYDFIQDEPLGINQRLLELNNCGKYSQVLALLSIIASTLFHYGTNDDDTNLHTLVLPPLPSITVSDSLEKARTLLECEAFSLQDFEKLLTYSLKNKDEKREAEYLLYKKAAQVGKSKDYKRYLISSSNAGYEPATLQRRNEEAENLLKASAAIYKDSTLTDSQKIADCCKNCEKILRLSPAVDKKYRGKASYILYKYCLAGLYTSPSGETAYQFLEISHTCGYSYAIDAWEKHNTFTITPSIQMGKSTSIGQCYTNSFNLFSTIFEQTIPTEWGHKLINLESTDFSKEIVGKYDKRILLIDDNYERNLNDLFKILQIIKDSPTEPETLKIEIFIRHDSDTIRSLIDTALSHMEEYLIPVYILNDAKIAAQQLLSQHPLFYPVSMVNLKSQETTTSERPILHFIVLGATKVAEWLVREAFWMMDFRNNAIESRITILDTNGIEFEKRLKAKFPGMIKKDTIIKGIELPEITGKNIDFDSYELTDEISSIIQNTPNCYFAVATDSDEVNLSLAMRIRESSIRTSITNFIEHTLVRPIPIAFLCKNDQFAWLSRSMVIEKEKHGNQWFNTWALIPFGEISNRYSWDGITGGTFHQLALCIHYQYNNVSAEDVQNSKKIRTLSPDLKRSAQKAIDAQKDFYLRQYNQDSSYSVALSMPYRLFQFQDTNRHQIVPIVWSILDKTVFSSSDQLLLLSERLNDFFINEDDWKQIAEWEHSRWVKWMLSRGWLPASFDESVFGFSNGNPRQQLFVAKLHPCICSYEDLKKLENILLEKCGLNRDFYTADLDNVKSTKKILALEWLREKTQETER